ncbi:Prefoldin alpha subunit [Carpediemonas membranifera]|uniref:Prefoldin alpha subunit n=1 Tax=Carpediemonas membranifera TaxID=201153 RepID=A0A8J6AQM7_9EUKA|nr:Prefoldin alpha subunit [Carpediemonas membranifera]|eukprot:KAG9391636.1 Prefoldin alpha subunit [Carpediemonas membranifera]
MADANPMGQQIDITTMPLDQLNMVKEQLEAEFEKLGKHLKQLQLILGKFNGAQNAIESYSQQEVGQEALIPVTESIYVPAVVKDNSKVLVDIGTGFVAEYTVAAAQDFFKRKAQMLTEQLSKLNEAVNVKNQNLQMTYQLIAQRKAEASQ